MNPTHLRIHPDTFKKIAGELVPRQHDLAGNTKEIKYLGLIVCLDKTVKEGEAELLDMKAIIEYLRDIPLL